MEPWLKSGTPKSIFRKPEHPRLPSTMNITPINPVASKPPAESLSVADSARREVSDAVATNFAKEVASAPEKPDFSKASLDDVSKFQFEGILMNMVNDAERQRQELREAMEQPG